MQFLKNALKEIMKQQGILEQLLEFHDIRQIATVSRTEAEAICRVACQTADLGNGTILCRVLSKYLFFADAGDIGLTPHLCLNGYWETWISQAFARIVESGWHCVDIGANQGYFSVLLSDLAGASGRLLAVEPNPTLIKFLAKNLEVNGFLQIASVVNKALADTNGERLKLIVPQGRALDATIFGEAGADDIVFEVETVTLDELTKDWDRVDFIKIDAEGAEERIWRGMSETIKRNPNITIVMEFKCSRYAEPQTFLQDILNCGFQLRHVDYNSQIEELTLEQALTERFDEDWMLFLQRSEKF